jgi:hypothetical protein
MKTEASRKPVPMEMGLADVLKTWRMECGYSQPSDYIFASVDMDGKQPLWPNSDRCRHAHLLRSDYEPRNPFKASTRPSTANPGILDAGNGFADGHF